MATLTETACYTRKAINWGIAGIFVLLIFKILFDFGLSAWRKINPPPSPPPTLAFGKLPAIRFPPAPYGAGLASPSAGLNFVLETIEGGPPNTSAIGTVFFISKPAINLLSMARARQFAAQLGFKGEPQPQTQTVYQWQEEANPLRTLQLDIVTNNFKLFYDYTKDPSIFTEKSLPTSEQAISEAKNFLKNLGLLSSTLENGQANPTFWQLAENNLVLTTSLANANAVRVDLGREDVEGLKLFPPYPPQELVYFIFSGSREITKRILEVSFKFWAVENEEKATYPLKTAAQAWEELKAGGGYIARVSPTAQTIVVRKIYLAFFYPEDYQSFLQPIFVFEGDPDFIAFVPAVSPQWAE